MLVDERCIEFKIFFFEFIFFQGFIDEKFEKDLINVLQMFEVVCKQSIVVLLVVFEKEFRKILLVGGRRIIFVGELRYGRVLWFFEGF